ncbi:hypothetical protein R6258_14700 [Halomonas sp. HP20-15]|uniref:hypothetical protein n=1 Tax=Halomonas sp. HP20-15 TaxID=3085901 RepID=UPI00298119D1|nr:hypothetical protein [Halomonas sp. HP20-15]MDW5378169.1 hypothetical protein [Halomonas sp. HP20-15]
MTLFLLIFVVSMVVIGGTITMMMLSRTPRYRTEPQHLLRLFDRVLSGEASANEWHTVVGYPVRHDEYLESVRRSAMLIMDEHGRLSQAAAGGSLLSRAGREELTMLRDHLAAHMALKAGQREF